MSCCARCCSCAGTFRSVRAWLTVASQLANSRSWPRQQQVTELCEIVCARMFVVAPSRAELAAGEKVDTMFAHARLASAVILIIQLRLPSGGCARISSINHSQMSQAGHSQASSIRISPCARKSSPSEEAARMRPASFSGARYRSIII